MFRRRRRTPPVTLERQPDALPKRGLFSEPVRVTRLDVADVEELAPQLRRVTFLVEVRDAEGRRCPDLAVESQLRGPERERVLRATTDLMGRLRFRMTGPPGAYDLEVRDVAAGGLDWDPGAGPTTVATTVEP